MLWWRVFIPPCPGSGEGKHRQNIVMVNMDTADGGDLGHTFQWSHEWNRSVDNKLWCVLFLLLTVQSGMMTDYCLLQFPPSPNSIRCFLQLTLLFFCQVFCNVLPCIFSPKVQNLKQSHFVHFILFSSWQVKAFPWTMTVWINNEKDKYLEHNTKGIQYLWLLEYLG